MKYRTIRWALLAVLAVLLSCSPLMFAQDEAAALFKNKCAPCHHEDGSGGKAAGGKMTAADLRSPEIQKFSDKELYERIATGVGHKQYPHTWAQRGLSDKQIQSLVAHIRTLALKK